MQLDSKTDMDLIEIYIVNGLTRNQINYASRKHQACGKQDSNDSVVLTNEQTFQRKKIVTQLVFLSTTSGHVTRGLEYVLQCMQTGLNVTDAVHAARHGIAGGPRGVACWSCAV